MKQAQPDAGAGAGKPHSGEAWNLHSRVSRGAHANETTTKNDVHGAIF